MAIELTVTAKGRVTLRQEILAHLGVGVGERLGATLLPDGRVELRAIDSMPTIKDLRAALRRPGQPAVTLAAMQGAIERGATSDG